MTEFDIIFADPATAAAYVYGLTVCLVIPVGWALATFRAPATRWTPELRAAIHRR